MQVIITEPEVPTKVNLASVLAARKVYRFKDMQELIEAAAKGIFWRRRI